MAKSAWPDEENVAKLESVEAVCRYQAEFTGR
jgi:hypothetical protein